MSSCVHFKVDLSQAHVSCLLSPYHRLEWQASLHDLLCGWNVFAVYSIHWTDDLQRWSSE